MPIVFRLLQINAKCQSMMQRFERMFNKFFLRHSIHPLSRQGDRKILREYRYGTEEKRDEISSRRQLSIQAPWASFKTSIYSCCPFFATILRHQIFPENLACDIRTISFTLSCMFHLLSSSYPRNVIIYDASNFEIARYVDEKHRHLSKVG